MVVVATLDGKAYYEATSLLKSMKIPFITITPGDRIREEIKLVLTTKKERGLVPPGETLFIEELGKDLVKAKEKILSSFYRGKKNELILGIDPGIRIGFLAFYNRKEIDLGVLGSVDELLRRVETVVECTKGRKVAKVGNGDPAMAKEIVGRILEKHGAHVEVEIVDEKGTSKVRNGYNRRGLMDLYSARLIALRQGVKISSVERLEPSGLSFLSRRK